MGTPNALAKRCPRLWERLDPLALADLPTPVTRLKLADHPALYLKRDDCSSRLYGGNKVRKLEFLLAAARRAGAATLVTMGGYGSNHLLATILHGRTLGMRTVGVVFPQPVNDIVRRNLAADRGAGGELRSIPSKYLLPVFVAATLVAVRAREGRWPHLIPGGGSSPLGALGFVQAGLELAEQVAAGQLPEPAAIFVAYGTGGTAAGLALGLQLAGLRTRVVAVRVIDQLLANRPRLDRFLGSVRHLLQTAGDPLRLGSVGANLEIRQGFIGEGYGVPTPAAEEAVLRFREGAGVELETTYTGKAAAAFLAAAGQTRGPLLFWNTYSSADIGEWVEKGKSAGGDEK